jgi:hypothetical protein
MKLIQVSAKFFSGTGVVATGLTVAIEVFQLASNSWIELAQAVTNTDGQISNNIRFASADPYAPNLRLREKNSNPVRILAQNPYVSYQVQSELLLCDFGVIEQLDTKAYRNQETQTAFAADKTLISGQAKRPNVSAVNIGRLSEISRVENAISTEGIAPLSDSRPVLESFDAELIKFHSIEAQLQQTISEKERIILDKDSLLVSTKKQVTDLQQEVEHIKTSESLLKQKNELFTQEANRLNPVQDIAMNIGTQINSANQKLREDSTPYQIHNIQLELRGTFSNDGKEIALAKLADGQEGLQNASVLKLDLIANQKLGSDLTIIVPDVTGLTETAVRRLLKSVGLQTQSLNKSVKSGSGFVHGQAISQSPAAGSKIPQNQTIMVIFATV